MLLNLVIFSFDGETYPITISLVWTVDAFEATGHVTHTLYTVNMQYINI